MTEVKRFSLVKPTLQTQFHIDFDWWSQNDNDWHVYLAIAVCPEHQQAFIRKRYRGNGRLGRPGNR